MSDLPPAKESNEMSLLADDEEERLSWHGTLQQGEDTAYEATFIATNSRLIFSRGKGHFKDVGLKYIESVEVASETKISRDGTDPDHMIAAGVVSCIIGIGSGLLGGFSPIATLAALAFCGFGVYTIWDAKTNYTTLKDTIENNDYEVYNIILRTNSESPLARPIHIKTRQNIGPALSKLVRSP